MILNDDPGLAVLKKIVLCYDALLDTVAAERGRNNYRYLHLRNERNALDGLWRRLKADN